MLLIVTTLWWLFFWTAIGLCLGSFLNAVVYRLPRNRSLREPVWSFCPACKHRIRWYDNIPILSFVILRGRCRRCGVPIATRYLVIEASMAIIVLMLFDAFFISGVRAGLDSSVFGLTEPMFSDWPIFVAHVILFACLLSMSAIDLEHYWVDIRFTNFATIAGFAMHAIWTPSHSDQWIRPSDTTAAVSLFAMVGLGLVWLVMVCQPHAEPALGEIESDEAEAIDTADTAAHRSPPPSLAAPSRLAGWIACVMLIATVVALTLDGGGVLSLRHTGRGLLPLVMFFFVIAWESSADRPADQEIVDAINEERHFARRMVMTELAWLLPAIVLALIGWWVMTRTEGASAMVSKALHSRVPGGGLQVLRGWSPLYGLATAASGYVIAGALGWAVRIFFTLAFGKEAFGSGDIHMMAAAGCVAGWPVVVLGFFLTCGLALASWILCLPFKRARALPLGPWLSLSFLTVVVFYDSMLKWPFIDRVIMAVQQLMFHDPQSFRIGFVQ